MGKATTKVGNVGTITGDLLTIPEAFADCPAPKVRPWTAAEERVLEVMRGRTSARELSKRWERAFGWKRTVDAISEKMRRV